MENTSQAPSSAGTFWRVAFSILGLGLAALILWASMTADLFESFAAIAADPWGVVALVDLYLGFFIFGVFVFLVDGVRPSSFVWVIALMVLGNVLSVVWLVLRFPRLMTLLNQKAA